MTAKSEHASAVTGFDMLYELLAALDWGKEIIFAEEAGSWMIPTDEKVWLKSYLTSLAATATPEEFVARAIPMLQRDSGHSFASKVYASALAVAAPAQRELLQKEMKRLKVRVAEKGHGETTGQSAMMKCVALSLSSISRRIRCCRRRFMISGNREGTPRVAEF